jgi:hypothetical protein
MPRPNGHWSQPYVHGKLCEVKILFFILFNGVRVFFNTLCVCLSLTNAFILVRGFSYQLLFFCDSLYIFIVNLTEAIIHRFAGAE